jgi:hypothetical protein
VVHPDPTARRESRRAEVRRRRRTTRLLVGGIGTASFILTLFVLYRLEHRLPPPVVRTTAVAPVSPASVAPAAGASDRVVYAYSIVPGGVHSAEDVVRAMGRDPVVAAHYAKVRPASLRVSQLAEPLQVHVSYRVGDQVYWTRRTLTIRAGERVLTDGSTTLRARCGNILSIDALSPALEDEPPPPDFDLHVEPFMPGGAVTTLSDSPPPLFAPPVDPHVPLGTPTLLSDPPPLVPRGTPTPLSGPPPLDPPLPVPEPSTWLLVAIGLTALLLGHLRKARVRGSR